MGKPLQQDENGNIINDVETAKNQKGYSDYEKEQRTAQRNRETKDESMMETARKVKEKIKSVLPFKKGGVTRADGCVKKGHTKGRMV
jgi:hypothetical protein